MPIKFSPCNLKEADRALVQSVASTSTFHLLVRLIILRKNENINQCSSKNKYFFFHYLGGECFKRAKGGGANNEKIVKTKLWVNFFSWVRACVTVSLLT